MKYIYGYARVSTKSQELDRQSDQLEEYGCDKIFSEKMTGTKKHRPELDQLKEEVRAGDTVVVESWSRLGRSTKDLIELVNYFQEKEVNVVSLKENFDTTTPQGKLMMTVFQAFAEFERDLIVQRVNEGLKAARARGRKGGRPRVNQQKLDQAIRLYNSREYSLKEIQEMTGISTPTMYRYLNDQRGNDKQV